MKTHMIALFLALALVFSLAACADKPAEPVPEPEASVPEAVTPEPEPEPEPKPAADSKLVGISMPTAERQRWKQDGEDMKKQLEQIGYEVDLWFAGNDPSKQISQLEKMIENGAKVLIIASIDGDALGTVLDRANEAGCSIIAYDRPIGSDAVSNYITFSTFSAGAAQAQFIVDRLNLDNTGDQVYNFELVGGDPISSSNVYFDGAMSLLRKYIEAGTLSVVSGQVNFEQIGTEDWSAEKAQERFENLLSTYYTDKQLDAVWCANDSTAQGVAAALENAYKNDVYPILTGWDCDLVSVKNILDGKQAMSVFMDTRNEAAKAVEMADALMKGAEPPTNFEYTTIDGAHHYPAFFVEPTVVTKDNIQEILIDTGYYTAEALGEEP